jgi:crotonobetainyl-CoA:carnitine CoA-transferase CaiB-like acyl-CoA transferase
MLYEEDHPQAGPIRQVGTPVKVRGEPFQPRPASAVGRDTEAVLAEILGYGASDLERLRVAGAIP